MSKKTCIFLISGLFILFGFFVIQFVVQAAPTLQSNLTIATSSSIIFQRSPATRSITGNSYGGNAATADYSTSAGTATSATTAGSTDTVDGYHLNQAVTIGANPTFGTVYTNNWFRSTGATGWTNDTYSGGWYMSDATWIRTQNSKNVWTAGGLLGTDGGVTSGYGGTTPPSGGAIFSGNIGVGTNAPGAKLDVRGETRIGDGTNYSKVDADGDLSLVGTADYLVDANRYAFRYSTSENYGLYLDIANLEYAFRTSDASKVFSINATSGNTYAKGSVGIGTTNPTSILALDGTTARTIQMERNTTAATAGQNLTISAGGAIAGTADLAGGDLILKSGVSTGSGSSALRFYTSPSSSGQSVSIGDSYEGGIVFYILQSSDPGYEAGKIKGLIAPTTNQHQEGVGDVWHGSNDGHTNARGMVLGTGLANTNSIVALYGAEVNAAKIAKNYAGGGYTDWYLPSKDELNKLYLNRAVIGTYNPGDYWSSTENTDDYSAWVQSFADGTQGLNGKYNYNNIRVVRSFSITLGGGSTDNIPAERMTILGSGNVGIGTTNPVASLEVAGTGIRLGGVTRTTWPAGSGSGFGVDAGSYAYYTGGNVGIGTTNPGQKLDVSGTVIATGYLYSSDLNLKKNITTIDSPLKKILELHGVAFNWKKDNSPSLGLIAQEVEKVFPELVSGEEGNKAVAYGNLVAPLIEALKEQQRELDQLETRITILEMKK